VPQRRALSRPIRVIQIVWIAGFLIGTTTHVVDLVLGGGDVYGGYPAGVRLFWVSLTLLDPVTAVLIAVRHRAGVVLGVLVMVADVTLNWAVFAGLGGLGVGGMVNLTVFGGFVLVTAGALGRAFSTPTRGPRPPAPGRTTG
jgi:hypothetical protein